MNSTSVIYMIAILGFVWGGFGYCLYVLTTARQPDDDEPEA
jgi:hypothetical protein